jgi:hypothetical protein
MLQWAGNLLGMATRRREILACSDGRLGVIKGLREESRHFGELIPIPSPLATISSAFPLHRAPPRLARVDREAWHCPCAAALPPGGVAAIVAPREGENVRGERRPWRNVAADRDVLRQPRRRDVSKPDPSRIERKWPAT